MERLRTALDPLRLGGPNEAVAQRMDAEDVDDFDEDEESETEEDLHLDMDEGDANAKSKVKEDKFTQPFFFIVCLFLVLL